MWLRIGEGRPIANWYVSSVAYTAVTQWAASATVTIGQIYRQLAAPSVDNERCWRVTTAGINGGAEPSWTLTAGSTTTSGTAVYTETTGLEAHQHDNSVTTSWTAPGARVSNVTIASKVANGDTIFVSSDHAETRNDGAVITISKGIATSPVRLISVDRTKSVPPVPADPNPLAGASVTQSSTNNGINLGSNMIIDGVSFTTAGGINFQTGAQLVIRNGTISQTGSGNSISCTGDCVVDLENITVNSNNVNQSFKWQAGGGILRWRNTSGTAAVSGTAPTNLFITGTTSHTSALFLDGLDLSALGGNTIVSLGTGAAYMRFFVTNCKMGSAFVWQGTSSNPGPVTELVNCDNGNTNYKNLRYDGFGANLSTETTVTMTGGATDGTTPYSHKIVSASNTNASIPFESFSILKWNSVTGSAFTATIQVLTTSTLKMSDIWMDAEYLSDSGTPLGSYVSTRAGLLDTTTPLSAGTGSWNSSPGGAVTLQMSATFTPNQVGWVRALVSIAKSSTTVWINPAFQ
jgi:hypothetical protein